MIGEIKIYILERRKNGRNRYLISAHSGSHLFDLKFFNGTYKQAVVCAEIMRDNLYFLTERGQTQTNESSRRI